jgi:serine/threonine protein kinase/predicted negative regulator of RcsB-dependent stress response
VSQHLDDNTLFELSEGLLGPSALAALEFHLDGCAECRRVVADVLRREVDCDSTANDLPTFPRADPDHYLVGEEFARGGMGRIRLARDLRLGRQVALKEMLIDGPDAIVRFEREARITARLQHPSIVNVHEAGVWPSGERFYTMTRLEGRSLRDVIAATSTFEARLALLPHMLAVADAMAFAHARGVIHRDLKPDNVLIGVFGETVVIDWGLAKDVTLGDPDAPLKPQTTGGAAWTVAGAVVGTPSYMPPEQAAGRPVDARADVYALGAILDHLLSGHPAYARDSALETLEAVRRGPPTPLAERQAGVPPDLLAIVERAMARDPSARYPTAGAFAEDLRRYQTGQLVGAHRYSLPDLLKRWVSKHRTPLVVAAIAAALLVVTGVTALRGVIEARRLADARRAEAEAERARAEASRADAEELLGFMLHDLPDKLTPIGRLDVLDDVAKKAVAYYDARPSQLDDRTLREEGVARRRLATVLFNQEHNDEALAQYRAALRLTQERLARLPADPMARRDLSLSHIGVGEVLSKQGDTAGALAEYTEALALDETLAKELPLDPDAQLTLAFSHRRVGEVLRWRDGPAALAHFEAALGLVREVVAKYPGNDAAERDLSTSLWRRGQALLAQSATASALVDLRAALDIDARRAARDPGNALFQHDLSVSEEALGDALRIAGDTQGALAHYLTALRLRETLARADPSNAQWQFELTAIESRLGDLLTAQGDARAALVHYRAVRALRARSASSDPPSLHTLSLSEESIGNALLTLGDTSGALQSYHSALELRRRAAAGEPTNIEWQRDLSISHNKLGDVLLAMGKPREALEQYRAASTLRETLMKADPTNPERLRDRAFSHEKVGDALLALGEPAALDEYRAEFTMYEALLARDPSSADRQSDVADAHEKLGDAHAKRRDPATARLEYRASLALRQTLVAREPQNAERKQLAEAVARKLRALN